MGSNQLHVVWDNHISNLQAVLYEFYNRHSLADVTISCKDGTLKAHKIILSACSPYFESVFQENPCEHPVVILKEISCYEMQILLQLMYRGSTDVLEENISDIIQTANELKVKGFVQAAVKNVTEDTGRLENDSGMYQRNSPSSDDESELHILKDVGHNEERYDLQDDVDSCDSVVLINNVIPTSDQVYKPTSDVNHSAMIFAPSSMEQTLETAYGQNRQTGEDVRTNNCGEDFLAEVRCKSMKRQQGKNDLKARKKVVEFQDSLSWSSEDEKTLSDQPRLTIASLNDETTLNVISTVDASIKQKSNLADKSARKDKFIHIIPNIQIKEEQIGAVDYSVVSTHCDKRNYKHTETVKQSACGNPADTHLPCIDISDVTSLVRRNEIPLKPHECEFCGLSFARAAHLARHRRVHTGERPFTCCLCQRTFTRQDKLRLHVLKYHGPHVKDAKHLTYLLTQKVAGSANNAAIEDDLRETGRGDSSLPFGDTSYLSSLSFGQQKYADSAVSATETLDSNADELLYSVRQLGECTIKAVVKQELNS